VPQERLRACSELGYTLVVRKISSRIQASARELDNALEDIHVFRNKDCCAWIEDALLRKSISEIVNSITLRGWASDRIPVMECLADVATHGGDADLTRHCLLHLSKRTSLVHSLQIAVLNAPSFARVQAKWLFQQSKVWEVSRFILAWSALLPADVYPLMSWLKGIAMLVETADIVTVQAR